MDFEVNSISKSDMKSIISFLSASLFDTGKYRVIDTAQRDTILKELEFSYSGCSDDSCQLEIGKLLSAEYIVTGDIAKVGTRYILSARMLETETSETAGIAKGIYASLDELIDDMPAFASALAGVKEAVQAEKSDAAPQPEAEPVQKTETAEEKESSAPNSNAVIAWSTLGAGTAMIGTGAYFLIDSILKINAVNDAEAAYMEATSDFSTLYDTYILAYNTAYDSNSNTLFWVGAGLAGGGIISAIVSIIFFAADSADSNPPVSVAVVPGTVAVRLSY